MCAAFSSLAQVSKADRGVPENVVEQRMENMVFPNEERCNVCFGLIKHENLIDNEETWNSFWEFARKDTSELAPEVDFSKHLLFAYCARGDCHMRASPRVYWDDSTNTLMLSIHKIFGACRAGGRVYGIMLIDKPSGDYHVKYVESSEDRF